MSAKYAVWFDGQAFESTGRTPNEIVKARFGQLARYVPQPDEDGTYLGVVVEPATYLQRAAGNQSWDVLAYVVGIREVGVHRDGWGTR